MFFFIFFIFKTFLFLSRILLFKRINCFTFLHIVYFIFGIYNFFDIYLLLLLLYRGVLQINFNVCILWLILGLLFIYRFFLEFLFWFFTFLFFLFTYLLLFRFRLTRLPLFLKQLLHTFPLKKHSLLIRKCIINGIVNSMKICDSLGVRIQQLINQS